MFAILSGSLQADEKYLTGKFKNPVFDENTGLDNETLKANLMTLANELQGQPHEVIKARCFKYVCENVRIDVNPHDWFVAFGCYDRRDRPLSVIASKWNKEVDAEFLKVGKLLDEQNQTGASIMWKDFDHSVPDWDAVFSLGFPGLRERARQYRKQREDCGDLTESVSAYFDGIEITYTAILNMMERFRRYAIGNAGGNPRVLAVADCLDTLINGPPTNTYEVLQLVYLFFMFGEHIDRFQIRSLGNLDRTVYPYYCHDLAEKHFTEPQIREYFAYFLMQWASINNYWGHPFYFGGTKPDGESEINELSYLILDVYDKLAIPTPKLQLKISPNTPTRFIDKALDMIRRGHSSIVFIGEPSIKRALLGLGCTAEEARTCVISGCYEFIPQARGNGTAAGHINMLKPIELVLNDGTDPLTGIVCGVKTGDLDNIKTFDDFYSAYIRQLDNIIDTIITCANDFEQYLHYISPAQVYSATIENSLKFAKDAFQDGSIYNISAILNAGFATAVDALMVIKEFVFDRHELTLCEFRDILEANWLGYEILRLKALNSKNKFGNGIDVVDDMAEGLARFLSNKINMRPNARGGFYVTSMHSARMFIIMGEKTGATPDGRLSGDEMSKNISPTMGMDTCGVTALVKSVTRIDSALFPGDFPIDVMMHPTTVSGDDGLAAMRTLLKTYIDRHGIAIHFNIFDPKTLRAAQEHPEQYEGLQVRVCGWNVYFNDIARKEQDEYIKRAESISQ